MNEVEKERLRFEGDLDKWMKIIGAGITGYQPEAYAMMDWACHELVRARSKIEMLEDALRRIDSLSKFSMHDAWQNCEDMRAIARDALTPTPAPSLSGIEEAIMDAIDDYRDSLPCTKYGPLEWPTVEGMKEAVRTGLRAALSATATEGE